MIFGIRYREVCVLVLIVTSLVGCAGTALEPVSTSTQANRESAAITPTNLPATSTTISQTAHTSGLTSYKFPDIIDPAKQYLFYIHGKIIEDQGLHAISPDYGEYEYEAILEKLSDYGIIVISEQRSKNTDAKHYARKIAEEVSTLLDAGVPAKNITVVGASKGAGITIYVSHFLENDKVNYVILAICHPDIVEVMKQDQVFLKGNILSIYDRVDEFAGSCQELFSFSEGKGISRYDEVILNIGTGHGILYQPMDEWILPSIQWANDNAE
ncbi:hypothetical protein ACFLUC_00935 [Chloroflexota bacterium]